MAAARRRLLISGRVQGVGFRYFVARQARALGLAGWVRNLRDGRVETEFGGPPESLDALTSLCARGPSGAHVTGVQEVAAGADDLPPAFETRADG